MTARNATVVLTRAQAAWLMQLCASAGRFPLTVTARKTNSAAYGQIVAGLADAMDRRRRRPAPAPPAPIRPDRWANTTWSRGEALVVSETGSVLRNRGFEVLPAGPGASV